LLKILQKYVLVSFFWTPCITAAAAAAVEVPYLYASDHNRISSHGNAIHCFA